MGDKWYFPTANSSKPDTGNNKFKQDEWTPGNLTTTVPMFQPTSDGTDITTSGICQGKHCPFYDDPTVMFPDEDQSVCRCADVLRYGQPYSLLMSTGPNKYPKRIGSQGQEYQMFWLNFVEPAASGELANVGQGGSVNVSPIGDSTTISAASNQTILDFIGPDGVNEPPRSAYFTFHSPIFPDGMPMKAGPQHAFYVLQHPGSNTGGTGMANQQHPTVWGTKFAQPNDNLVESDSANYRYYNWVCAQSYDAIPWNVGLSSSGAGLANTSCFMRDSNLKGNTVRSSYSDRADFNSGGQWPPLFYFDATWVIPELDKMSENSGDFSTESGITSTTDNVKDMLSNHGLNNRQRYAKSPDKFPDQQPYVMATLPYAIRSTVGWFIHFGSSHSDQCKHVHDKAFPVNSTDHRQRLDTWATNCTDSGKQHNGVTTYYQFSVFQAIPYKVDRKHGDEFEPETIFLGKAVSDPCSTDDDCAKCTGTTCAQFQDTDGNDIRQKCISTGYWGDKVTGTSDYFSTQKFCAPVQTEAAWDELGNDGNTEKFLTQTDMYILGGIGLLLICIVALVFYWFVLSYRTSKVKGQIKTKQQEALALAPSVVPSTLQLQPAIVNNGSLVQTSAQPLSIGQSDLQIPVAMPLNY
jgi:hypothetical protein